LSFGFPDSVIPVAVLPVVKVPFGVTAEKLSVVSLLGPALLFIVFLLLFSEEKMMFFQGW